MLCSLSYKLLLVSREMEITVRDALIWVCRNKCACANCKRFRALPHDRPNIIKCEMSECKKTMCLPVQRRRSQRLREKRKKLMNSLLLYRRSKTSNWPRWVHNQPKLKARLEADKHHFTRQEEAIKQAARFLERTIKCCKKARCLSYLRWPMSMGILYHFMDKVKELNDIKKDVYNECWGLYNDSQLKDTERERRQLAMLL